MKRKIEFPMSGKTIRELERKGFTIKDIAVLSKKNLLKSDKKTIKKLKKLDLHYNG